jgi:hypothetical protein
LECLRQGAFQSLAREIMKSGWDVLEMTNDELISPGDGDAPAPTEAGSSGTWAMAAAGDQCTGKQKIADQL